MQFQPPTSRVRCRGTELVGLRGQVPRRRSRQSVYKTIERRRPGDSPVATRYYLRAPLASRVVSFRRDRRLSLPPAVPAQDWCRAKSPIPHRSGDLFPPSSLGTTGSSPCSAIRHSRDSREGLIVPVSTWSDRWLVETRTGFGRRRNGHEPGRRVRRPSTRHHDDRGRSGHPLDAIRIDSCGQRRWSDHRTAAAHQMGQTAAIGSRQLTTCG